MKRYIIYTNDNGTDAYPLNEDDDIENKFKQLIEEHEDDYFEIDGLYLEVENDKILVAWKPYIPEFEDEWGEDFTP